MRYSFWQSEWQNIQFNTLKTPTTFFKRPSSMFYNDFYKEVFIKYASFEELPLKWRKEKSDTAKVISDMIATDTSILSVGCGLGYIEKCFVKLNPNLKIDAYDFAVSSKKWLMDIKGINCLTKLDSKNKYKFIYCSQVFYALSNKEIKDFTSFVLWHLDKEGIFLTIDTSLRENENGLNSSASVSKLVFLLKNFLLPFFYNLFRKKSIQFWGWRRDNLEIIKLLESNGLILKEKFSTLNQSFLVFEKKY